MIFISLCFTDVCGNEFPLGIYDKYDQTSNSREWYRYYGRLANFLRENSMNAIVLQPLPLGSNPDLAIHLLDIMQEREINVIQTIGNALNSNWDKAGRGQPFHRMYMHPAIIAYKYGDEPKDKKDLAVLKNQYDAIQMYYEKPIVTAVIGEALDGSYGFTEYAWNGLNSKIKFARYYTFRRKFVISEWNSDKTKLRFDKWCEYMEVSHNGKPWWFIPQGFGTGKNKEHASYWRFPTATEMKAQLHIALANGVRGLFLFSLQSFEKNTGLVNDKLIPNIARDNSSPLSAYTEVAKLVSSNNDFFVSHKNLNLLAAADNNKIYVTTRYYSDIELNRYAYIVNMDTENKSSSLIRLEKIGQIEKARNIFSGQLQKVEDKKSHFSFSVELEPGEGQLWLLL